MSKQNTHIIVAEDNARDREFLKSVLNKYTLYIAINGDEALAYAHELHAKKLNINIVSDIQMPKLNGIELSKQVWEISPDARIIFWSQFRDEIYLRSLNKIIPPQTVYGYVLKTNTSKVLEQAVDWVFNEFQCWIDPKIRSEETSQNKQPDLISHAEYEVLVDIALGLTDNMIAERRYLTRRGVQSRLKLLYQKLGSDRASAKDDFGEIYNSRSRAISLALNRGLINPFELKRAEKLLQQWLHHGRN